MLELIVGPMYAGKTTMLMHKLERYMIAEKKCLIIKHCIDTRNTEDVVVNHAGVICNRDVDVVNTHTISSIRHLFAEYDAVGITEAQFFCDIQVVADIVDVSYRDGAKELNVICEGLDGCFNRESFGDYYKLIPRCDKITKLTAVCKCGKDAIFSTKISLSDSLVDIGGKDKYIPTCRKCYLEKST